MKIAIHNGGGTFCERWIAYCDDSGIDYKLVCAYDSDIVDQVRDCDAFMWHHSHTNYRDRIFAYSLLCSLETAGKRVFPDSRTCWHFDDKVAQKYLLESLQAPLVPSYVLYSQKEAMKWIEKTEFPKVFKLRGGAGSANVRLAKTRHQARQLSRRAFTKGFPQYNPWRSLKERWFQFSQGQVPFRCMLKGLVRVIFPPPVARFCGNEKGYLYFQDFIPGNRFDIRIIVIGKRAFGIKRVVRKNDFRASGSGEIIYRREEIDERCVAVAFATSRKGESQCTGYDFVFGANGEPLIVEMSYGFSAGGYDSCEGYWSEDMTWHAGSFNPYGWMIDELIWDDNA